MKKYSTRILKLWVISISLIIIFVGFSGCIQSTSTQKEKQSIDTTPILTPIQAQIITTNPTSTPDFYVYCRSQYPGSSYNSTTNTCEYPTTTTPIFTPLQTPIITPTSTPTINYYEYCRNQYPGSTYNPSLNSCQYPMTATPTIATTPTPTSGFFNSLKTSQYPTIAPIITTAPISTPDFYVYCRNQYPGSTYNPSKNTCEYSTTATPITTTTPTPTPTLTQEILHVFYQINTIPNGARVSVYNCHCLQTCTDIVTTCTAPCGITLDVPQPDVGCYNIVASAGGYTDTKLAINVNVDNFNMQKQQGGKSFPETIQLTPKTLTVTPQLNPTFLPTPYPTVASSYCYFLISSNPIGAYIFLDGQYRGITTSGIYTTVLTTAGIQHSLLLTKQGYQDYSESNIQCSRSSPTPIDAGLTKTIP